jgi:hypothetical protein
MLITLFSIGGINIVNIYIFPNIGGEYILEYQQYI